VTRWAARARGRLRTQALALAAPGALACAAPAWAHSPIEGLGNFYGGVLHPVLVPAHFVLLLALGLLLGGQGERPARLAVVAWLVAVGLGLVVLALVGGWTTTPMLLAVAALLGMMVAAAWRLPTALLVVLAAAVGLGLALDSDPELESALDRHLAMAGTALGAVLVTAAGLLIAESSARRNWQRIGVRVLGSWIAASAIMVTALGLVGARTDEEPAQGALAASSSAAAPTVDATTTGGP
jgi:urease accessory protein